MYALRVRAVAAVTAALAAGTSAASVTDVLEDEDEVYATLHRGFELPPSYGNWSVTAGTLHGDPIEVGSFDETHGPEGLPVLVKLLDIGTAPISSVTMPGGEHLSVSVDEPQGWSFHHPGDIFRNVSAITIGFPSGSAEDGSGGSLWVGYALLEHPNQTLEEALGVAMPFDVRIRDGSVGGHISPSTQHKFVRGGAARFQEVLLPETDWRPGSCPKRLNTAARGRVPVAIIGTDSIRVRDLMPESITLAGNSPVRWAIEDISGRMRDVNCNGSSLPGHDDLVLWFRQEELVDALPSNDLEAFEFTLEGQSRGPLAKTLSSSVVVTIHNPG